MWTLHPESTCGFSVLWKCHVSYSGHKWTDEFPRLQCEILSSTCRNQRYVKKMMFEEVLMKTFRFFCRFLTMKKHSNFIFQGVAGS